MADHLFWINKHFAIHLLPEGRSFLVRICNYFSHAMKHSYGKKVKSTEMNIHR